MTYRELRDRIRGRTVLVKLDLSSSFDHQPKHMEEEEWIPTTHRTVQKLLRKFGDELQLRHCPYRSLDNELLLTIETAPGYPIDA